MTQRVFDFLIARLQTAKPALPQLADTSDQSVSNWARQLTETIGRVTGQTAHTAESSLDTSVTFRDLVKAGIAVKAPPGLTVPFVAGADPTVAITLPPPAPTGFVVQRLPYNERLTWTAPTYSNHLLTEVWRAASNNLSLATKVASVPAGINLYEDGYVGGQAYYYWIRFVSKALVSGAFNAVQGTTDGTLPDTVQNLAYSLEGFAIRLTWTPVSNADLAVYELRQGTTWDAATKIDEVKATSYLWRIQSVGTYRVWVRARDINGFYSGSATSLDLTISAPAQTMVTATLVGDSVSINWQSIVGSFAMDFYEIRYGTDWATGTLVDRTFSTTELIKVTWGGLRRFWVAGKDVAGNYATPASVDVVITIPGQVATLSASVDDNNVLFYWTPPATGSLPIATYELWKGATFATATKIGEKSGLFTTVFEVLAGTYTYWFVARDTAGNEGTPAPITKTVNQPPDFVLYSDQNLVFATATLSNAILESGDVVLPFDTTKTWATHFTSQTWNTPQDQINAGYPIYAQPVPGTAYIEESIDYGASIPSSTITVTPTYDAYGGTPTISVQISVKLNATDAWTALSAGAVAFAGSPFRYVLVRVTVTSPDTKAMARMHTVNVKLSVKQRTDAGQATANATDTNGTLVNFNVNFISVSGQPQVTPQGTAADGPLIATVDFTNSANPTSFKVFIWNTSGVRKTAQFGWIARGV